MTRPLLLLSLLLSTSAMAGDAPRRDLGQHFVVGFAMGSGLHATTAAWVPSADPVLVAIVGSFGVGAAKEGIDALGFGQPDVWDLLFTWLGALAGVAFSVGVEWLVMQGGM